MVNNSYSYHTKTSVKEKPNEEDIDIVDSLKNFLPSRGNHLSRPVIPIGPRFQAEVPKWEATTNIKQYNNDDCLKWLGTQIWPMSNICKSTAKEEILEYFPSKPLKCMMNYYCNPRYMSIETRSPFGAVDCESK
ncbi:hypothetical protein P8452_64879 [Trifolium repens]|nr:hypothetical protein P8452_64879 [Trifolium repens]